MKELKYYTNEELLTEYKAYDDQINGNNPIYNTKDVMWYYEIVREMDRRDQIESKIDL